MSWRRFFLQFKVQIMFFCAVTFVSALASTFLYGSSTQFLDEISNGPNEQQIAALDAIENKYLAIRYGDDSNSVKDFSDLNQIVISIGQHCEVAAQIQQRALAPCFYPLDWINSMDFDSILAFMADDFKSFLDIKNLEVGKDKSSSNHLMVFDKKYNVLFPHDFPLDQTITQGYDLVKSKYQRRIERFFKALGSGKHVYFVRKHLSKQQSIKFVEIMKIKHPKLKFTLVAVNNTEEFKHDWKLANIRNFFYGSKTPGVITWEGDKGVWDDVFKSLGITWISKESEKN